MEKLRRYGLTFGTIAMALGIGYVVQMDATQESLGYGGTMGASAMTVRPAEPAVLPDNITLISAQKDIPEDPFPIVTALAVVDDLPRQPVDPKVPELVCDVVANAETLPGAMVALTVSAPCLPQEQVTVHHNGMMFSDFTDASGQLQVNVPALAVQAVLIVEFTTGQGAVAIADVPSLAFYDRVALQWTGSAGFQLHALEYGAFYGEDGHVWAGKPRSPEDAANGNQGFITHLGASGGISPRIAEVYTFPRATASREGVIRLSIEAEVTAGNCGQQVEAQSLELRDDEVLRTSDLVLSVPGCDATGDFLVLNNLLDDLRIAAK